jgi:hypothetical protein
MRKLRYPIAMFVTTVLAVIAIGVVIMVLAMATLTKAHLVAGLTVASLPETTGQLGVQNPQLHGGPIWPAQEAISSKVSAQTFW